MKKYEITYLISDDIAENEIKKVSDKVAGFVLDEGGKVIKEESWGRRKLTYPIKKQTFATYITANFEIPAEKVATFDHEIRVFAPIIRHLIITKTTESKDITLKKDEVLAEEDVKEVIGAKSFEVVEGQSEKSFDLMAKRGAEEKKPEAEDVKPKKEAKTETTEKITVKEEAKKKTIKKPLETEVDQKMAEKPKTERNKEDDESESERIKKLDEKLDKLLSDDL
ncbi:MAG: hypothetical protein Athens101428_790 [Candidatus Berkelbacteria bacterium Athens1014_28]|uniref:Small ribosomal subunit protein bS6 n=1 Tax=Candidatus Berkelbacteria bacterium Athens1014_28 TaxID=2017145 RepID=A0A554LIX8_9BACT|nr:MAG: hypothetical protein Athens101428_790 [Candidatus Berkelbacteria bacterium Athens1014_28]